MAVLKDNAYVVVNHLPRQLPQILSLFILRLIVDIPLLCHRKDSKILVNYDKLKRRKATSVTNNKAYLCKATSV